MDFWIQHQRSTAYDSNGEWARSGQINNELLARLKADAYFHEPPPKSTGFEYFNLAWLGQHLGTARLAAEDVQATLLELTVATVADALGKQSPDCAELVVCGGGAHNGALMSRLAEAVSEGGATASMITPPMRAAPPTPKRMSAVSAFDSPESRRSSFSARSVLASMAAVARGATRSR